MASVLEGVPALQNVNVQPALSNFAGVQDQQARLSQMAQQGELQKQAAQEARSEKAMTYIANAAHGAQNPAEYSAAVNAVADQFPDIGDKLRPLADPTHWDQVKQMTTSYAERIAGQNATRAQANADRSFGLQERQVKDAESNASFDRTAKPVLQKVTNPDGSESIVRVMPDGTSQPVYGGNGSGTNPYSVGKMTPEQGKVGTFVDRMAAADKILQNPDVANVNTGIGGAIGAAAENILPGGLVGPLSSNARQMSMQAKTNFLNAVLRRESGAAISSGEFASGNRQYFPQPNDSSEVLAQKAANRQNEITGFMREAGPNYKPPAGYAGPGAAAAPQANTAAPAGAPGPSVSLGGATPAGASSAAKKGGKPFDAGTVADVQKAVAAGVPRDAIIKRLQDNGYDTSELGK